MGKWATYRKRGLDGKASRPLTAPPGPLISQDGDDLVTWTPGADNYGGILKLEYSENAGATWILIANDPWARDFPYGDIGGSPGWLYRLTSIGNGTAYVGSSPFSNILTWT